MSNEIKVEKEQVSISFRERPYVPTRYLFEMDDRTDYEQTSAGAVRVRLYPASTPYIGELSGFGGGVVEPIGNGYASDYGFGAITSLDGSAGTELRVSSGGAWGDLLVKTTEGRLLRTTEVREKEVFGSTTVSGEAEVSLQYPVVRELSYSLDGRAYDVRGRSISVNMAFDSVRNALVFSRPFYGVVRFSYITNYRIFRYLPNVYNDVEMYYMPDPNDYGQLMGFQTTPPGVDAIPPLVFAVSPPPSISAEFELYRVESAALANETGLWEKPTGWPTNGLYNGYTAKNQQLDTNGSYVEVARTHEIAYFSLFNQPRRMEGYQSSSSGALPLDFGKELTFASEAGNSVKLKKEYSVKNADGSSVNQTIVNVKQVQDKEYFAKYRRLLNNAPTMRVVYYDVPVAEPYNSASNIRKVKDTVRLMSGVRTTVRDASGKIVSYSEQVTEALVGYRIKLVVKVPNRPAISQSTLRNQSNNGSTDLETQALRVNTMLSLIWEGVDWVSLRKRIRASYDPDIYQVTFDSSFPGSN